MKAWPGRPGDLFMPPSLTQLVYDDLVTRIESGEWGPGDRLPRIRELVEHYNAKFGASEQPVQMALTLLRHEKRIVGQRGSGMFLPE